MLTVLVHVLHLQDTFLLHMVNCCISTVTSALQLCLLTPANHVSLLWCSLADPPQKSPGRFEDLRVWHLQIICVKVADVLTLACNGCVQKLCTYTYISCNQKYWS